MNLRDFTIYVLHRHGIIRAPMGVTYMVELVDMCLFNSRDMLMSKMFKDLVCKYDISLKTLFRSLRDIAQTIKRKDPEWYDNVFKHGYDSYLFVRIISREVLAAYCAYLEE